MVALIIWFSFLLPGSQSGKMTTTTGHIRFFSEAPVENIEANNHKVRAAIDLSNGDLLFVAPIRDFIFEKGLMQKHFNQQYMESDKFPEARFVGKISDVDKIMRERPSVHTLSGQLTIHGVTKTISEKATLQMHEAYLSGTSKFRVRTADFDIRIPRMLIKNIAEEIEVTVDVKFNPVKP